MIRIESSDISNPKSSLLLRNFRRRADADLELEFVSCGGFYYLEVAYKVYAAFALEVPLSAVGCFMLWLSWSRVMDTVTPNGPCVTEKCGQDSQEDMVGIRSIIVQQETLFKEQVQALHRLYKVQKLEMQQLEKRNIHLNLETAELTDGFSSVSGLEDKSGELVRPVARVYEQETGSLSLHPFCSLKLFEGCGSVSFGGSFQRLEGFQCKQARDFDLERFPEGWVDESVIVIQPDNSSPTSKESEIACVEDYKSGKSNDTSEDGLLITSSGKVVSIDAEGIQDSSPADPMDRKAKLSHQGSFASVNGCLNSSISEGEENNSKIAATFKVTEGIMVAEVGFPKMEVSHNGQTPPSRPQCCSSDGHSKFVPGSADGHKWASKIGSKGIQEQASDIPVSEGLQSYELLSGAAHMVSFLKTDAASPLKVDEEKENTQESIAAGTSAALAPDKSIQQLAGKAEAEAEVEAATDFHASSNESSNTSKRKHRNETIEAESGFDKLMKFSKSA